MWPLTEPDCESWEGRWKFARVRAGDPGHGGRRVGVSRCFCQCGTLRKSSYRTAKTPRGTRALFPFSNSRAQGEVAQARTGAVNTIGAARLSRQLSCRAHRPVRPNFFSLDSALHYLTFTSPTHPCPPGPECAPGTKAARASAAGWNSFEKVLNQCEPIESRARTERSAQHCSRAPGFQNAS